MKELCSIREIGDFVEISPYIEKDSNRNLIMQRVPTVGGFYDNVVEDHNYTMFSMYPTINNHSTDFLQLSKEEKAVVNNYFSLIFYVFYTLFKY
ncbi:hypothetical protein M0802_015576 [Mischocyttarus mexicanus]|nr:hypothetical protein M0802_015576 [Mischocyttarus mexicanus]